MLLLLFDRGGGLGGVTSISSYNGSYNVHTPGPAFPSLGLKSCNTNIDPGAIQPLDYTYAIPCAIDPVPTIKLTPDQRDSLFPAVSIKTDRVAIAAAAGCAAKTTGSTSTNPDIGSDSVTSTDALTDSWTKDGAAGLQVVQRTVIQTRTAFSPTSGLFAFFRTYCYDSCGQLISISAETKKTISAVGNCP